MSDFFASTVILPALSKVEGSERSLPAVAGESKDLYLMQHARMHAEAEFAQAVDPMEVLRREQQSEEGQNDHSAQACL